MVPQQQFSKGKINLTETYICSPNIAWIKYWGKYDEQNIIPLNDNLGLTLNSDDINTITTIKFAQFPQTSLMLNGEEHPVSKRVVNILQRVKSMVKERKFQQIKNEEWQKYNFKIQSANSFPTASGLASSASGLACLVAALNGLFGNIFTEDEVSELARRGSGSASRSIYGGLVKWTGIPQKYSKLNQQELSQQEMSQLNKICLSKTVIPAQQLEFIDVFVLLANWKQKEVTSTDGMRQSMQTSELIKVRNSIVSQRCQLILQNMRQMIESQSREQHYSHFNQVAETIIKDSNQFHAICLDTYPPILYLEEFSRQIMYIVDHILNPVLDVKIGYTFDAGPHAFLFMHKDVTITVLKYFKTLFSLSKQQLNAKGNQLLNKKQQSQSKKYEFKQYPKQIIKPVALWLTDVGKGAQKYNQEV